MTFLKRSLIVNLLKHELSTASLQSSTGKVLPVEDCRLAVESSCFNKFTIRERFRNFTMNPGRASSIFNIDDIVI